MVSHKETPGPDISAQFKQVLPELPCKPNRVTLHVLKIRHHDGMVAQCIGDGPDAPT